MNIVYRLNSKNTIKNSLYQSFALTVLDGVQVLAVQADVSAGADNEAVVENVVKQTMEKFGRVCVQLASPDFKYMSGETLTLEGGMGLRP